MTLLRRIGFGVVLNCDPTGGTTYAALGAIVDGLDGGDAKTTAIDTTILGDKFMTKGGGQIDPGEVTFTIAYDPLDAATNLVLTTLLGNSNVAHFQISYPAVGGSGATTETFFGFVSGYKRTIAKDKMITAEVTITISGDPGFTGD